MQSFFLFYLYDFIYITATCTYPIGLVIRLLFRLEPQIFIVNFNWMSIQLLLVSVVWKYSRMTLIAILKSLYRYEFAYLCERCLLTFVVHISWACDRLSRHSSLLRRRFSDERVCIALSYMRGVRDALYTWLQQVHDYQWAILIIPYAPMSSLSRSAVL